MKQEIIDMTSCNQETSSNRTRVWSIWSVAMVFILTLTVFFGWQFSTLSPLDKAALSDYLAAINANELATFK